MNVQCKQIHHLEDAMIMYGVYNSDTLKDLIDTVHRKENFRNAFYSEFSICELFGRYNRRIRKANFTKLDNTVTNPANITQDI